MLSTQRRGRRARRQTGLLLESLDDRLLLSGGALPANVSAPLRSLYHDYVVQVRDSHSTPGLTGPELAAIRSARVAVRIKVAFPPAQGAYESKLRADGMQIIRTAHDNGMAEGTLPIAKLPAAAQLAAHVWPATLPIKK